MAYVVCDHSYSIGAGDAGDQHIKFANRPAASFQVGANLAIFVSRRVIKGQADDILEEIILFRSRLGW